MAEIGKMPEEVEDKKLRMLQTTLFSDCSFLIGSENNQQLIKAHRIILTLASSVFESMFLHDYKGDNDDVILVADVDPVVFSSLLDHIYCSETKLYNFDDALKLYNVAQKFAVLNVITKCTYYMCDNLDISNACMMLDLGHSFKDMELQYASLQFIQDNTEKILSHDSFKKMKLCSILTIFEQNELNILSENMLYMALHRWAMDECERQFLEKSTTNLRKIVGSAPEKIRFLNMTTTDFNDGTLLPTLLTSEEIMCIVMHIGVRNNKFPLPLRFSYETVHRIIRPLVVMTPINDRPNEVEKILQSTLVFTVDKIVIATGFQLRGYHNVISIESVLTDNYYGQTCETMTVNVSDQKKIYFERGPRYLRPEGRYKLIVRESYEPGEKPFEHSHLEILTV